jgi:choline transport protein
MSISLRSPAYSVNGITVIYGFILVFILQCFLGASLAEFVSAYPVEGGMYHWIAAIAPGRYNSFLSFCTGWSTVFGCEGLLVVNR